MTLLPQDSLVFKLAAGEEIPCAAGAVRFELTGTAAEVTPVGEIGPYKFTVGAVTRALMDDYAATVRGAPNA